MHSRTIRPVRLLVIVALATVLNPSSTARTQASGINVASLLARAIHDTNTVRTLSHTSTGRNRSARVTADIFVSSQEDEVHNAEVDHERVKARMKQSGGKTVVTTYTIDLVFLHGKTYYRQSLAGNRWHVQNGMIFRDEFSGTLFQRGRTTVPAFSGVVFAPAGKPQHGVLRVRGHVTQGAFNGTVEYWLTTGRTPYVIRLDSHGYVAYGTRRIPEAQSQTFGSFNRPLHISAPRVTTG